jgi:predicted GIY-YIG superfamily endonuclease
MQSSESSKRKSKLEVIGQYWDPILLASGTINLNEDMHEKENAEDDPTLKEKKINEITEQADAITPSISDEKKMKNDKRKSKLKVLAPTIIKLNDDMPEKDNTQDDPTLKEKKINEINEQADAITPSISDEKKMKNDKRKSKLKVLASGTINLNEDMHEKENAEDDPTLKEKKINEITEQADAITPSISDEKKMKNDKRKSKLKVLAPTIIKLNDDMPEKDNTQDDPTLKEKKIKLRSLNGLHLIINTQDVHKTPEHPKKFKRAVDNDKLQLKGFSDSSPVWKSPLRRRLNDWGDIGIQ